MTNAGRSHSTYSARRPSIGFNMTPMIDVVFLLIIFFLVSSHLARQETQLELDLPTALTGEDEIDVQRPRVVINVSADGRVMMGSEPMTPPELAGRLRHERQHFGNDLEIRIRSDRFVRYGVVEPILLACAEAGVWNVTFAVTDKSDHQ